jgi:hypothetical protein
MDPYLIHRTIIYVTYRPQIYSKMDGKQYYILNKVINPQRLNTAIGEENKRGNVLIT